MLNNKIHVHVSGHQWLRCKSNWCDCFTITTKYYKSNNRPCLWSPGLSSTEFTVDNLKLLADKFRKGSYEIL